MPSSVKSQTEKGKVPTALLLGVGYTARAIIPRLKEAGYNVVGTNRSGKTTIADVEMLSFTGLLSESLERVLDQADVIISSIPPTDAGDLVSKTIAPYTNPKWVGYLSATSVYGNRNGHWVFEDEFLYPTTQRGKNRVEAELDWLETGLPVHVFRLAGIYGPELNGKVRNPFKRIRNGQAKCVIKPGHVVNRIHVEDIAAAIMASIARPDPAQVYNIADGHPAPPQDVLKFAADLLGLNCPPEITHDDASLSDMARSFYTETKRVSIDKAKKDLGWTPKYTNFQLGLRSILSSDVDKSNLGL